MLRTMLVKKPILPISAFDFFVVLAGLSVAIALQASFDYAELEKSRAAFVISSHAGSFESLLTGALFSAQTVRSFVEAGPSQKVETTGDLYMVVAETPDPGDPKD